MSTYFIRFTHLPATNHTPASWRADIEQRWKGEVWMSTYVEGASESECRANAERYFGWRRKAGDEVEVVEEPVVNA